VNILLDEPEIITEVEKVKLRPGWTDDQFQMARYKAVRSLQARRVIQLTQDECHCCGYCGTIAEGPLPESWLTYKYHEFCTPECQDRWDVLRAISGSD